MKNKILKISVFTLASIAFITLFTVLCVFTYQKHWNLNAFWWPWVGALFLIDLITSIIIFNNKNRTDENKSFWLFLLLVLPYFGFFAFLCFGLSTNCKNGSHSNNALILESIFQAKESIVICTPVFFPPYDVLDALNFASQSNKKIIILVTRQQKKYIRELQHHRFERQLSRKINIYFTDVDIVDSFMIFDNKKVVVANYNFNYKNVFNDKPLPVVEDGVKYNQMFKTYMSSASLDTCEIQKRPPYKRIALSLANIFYIIL